MTYSLARNLVVLGFGLMAVGTVVFVPSFASFLQARRHVPFTQTPPEILKGKTIILIGASVGSAWRLEKHFRLINLRYYHSGDLGDLSYPEVLYRFDKGDAVRFYTAKPKDKRPDAVILKECSAYFPPKPNQPIADYAGRKEAVKEWVRELREAGIAPILATVVPVARGSKADIPDRLELIQDYNDWVREYAASEGIAVLDLEKAVRASDSDRSLPASKTTDGMHLIPRTYSEDFDPIVYPTLVRAFSTERNEKGRS
jgi:hypothetical protein